MRRLPIFPRAAAGRAARHCPFSSRTNASGFAVSSAQAGTKPHFTGQHVHADLPHAFTIRRTAGQAHQPCAVVRAHGQHVQFPPFFAQSVAPFRPVQAREVRRPQHLQRIPAIPLPHAGNIRKKIFRHEAYPHAEGTQRVRQHVHVRRFKAMLGRIPLHIGPHGCLGLGRDGSHHVAAVGDKVAEKGQRQIFPRPGMGRGTHHHAVLPAEVLRAAIQINGGLPQRGGPYFLFCHIRHPFRLRPRSARTVPPRENSLPLASASNASAAG